MTPTGSARAPIGGDGGPAVLATLTLPGLKRSARQARSFVREALGPDHPVLDDVQTCVSEAFTNGLLHTDSGRGGKITILISVADDAVHAEVTDDGAGGERPCRRDEPLGEFGRGMLIIGVLAQEWGVRADGERTTVWMRFPGDVPPAR